MEKEERLNKVLYKLELYLLKIIPYLLAGCYFANTILSYGGLDVPVLPLIGGMSILPFIFIYVSSFVFKYCFYHRLPLYYILISDIIAYYDIYFGVPVSTRTLFSINLSIAGIFLFLIIYLKLKYAKTIR